MQVSNEVCVLDQFHSEHAALYCGDCIELIKGIPDESVGLSCMSPPFPSMYAYTNSPRDLGNTRTFREMLEHFGHLIPDLLRVTLPGRSCCVHLTQAVAFKGVDGYVGLKDFRGETIRLFEAAGWIYYGEVTIDKNPQVKAIRTKDRGLLFQTLENDSSHMHMALADHLLQFRKPGENPVPMRAGAAGSGWVTREEWIRWARPVWYSADWSPQLEALRAVIAAGEQPGEWTDNPWLARVAAALREAGITVLQGDPGIRETDVLNVEQARETDDERHLCPLQLGVIERAIKLWSNPGDGSPVLTQADGNHVQVSRDLWRAGATVLTPFLGIGSEVVQAVRLGRYGIGCELKPSYYRSAVRNVEIAESEIRQLTLFDLLDAEAEKAEAVA